MAHGQRATAALGGAAAGAAAGPIGAAVGGVAGYVAAALPSLLGGKKKSKPPAPQPWYVKHAAALTIGGVLVFGGLLVGVAFYATRKR